MGPCTQACPKIDAMSTATSEPPLQVRQPGSSVLELRWIREADVSGSQAVSVWPRKLDLRTDLESERRHWGSRTSDRLERRRQLSDSADGVCLLGKGCLLRSWRACLTESALACSKGKKDFVAI